MLHTPRPRAASAAAHSLYLVAGPTDGANGGSGGDHASTHHAHHVKLAARAAPAIRKKAVGGRRPMVAQMTIKGFFSGAAKVPAPLTLDPYPCPPSPPAPPHARRNCLQSSIRPWE